MSRNKLISIVCTLALLVGFFCVPDVVHAENSYIRYIRTYSGSISAASFTYKATACNFNFQSDTSLSGGIYQPVLISVNFRNNGSNDIKLANVNVELTFSSAATIQGYENYTSDLYVVVDGTAGQHTPTYKIFASNEYSYTNGFVIPALSNMTLVFEVDVASSINTSTGQPEGPYIDAIAVTGVTDYYSTGDYVTGVIPKELQNVETLLGYLATNQTVNTFYNDVHTLLTDIKNQIRFTGTFTPPDQSQYSSQVYTVDVSQNQYFDSFTIRRTVFPSYNLNYDFELNGQDVVEYGYKRYVIEMFVQFNATTNFTYNNFYINVPFTTSVYLVPTVNSINSNVFINTYSRGSVIYLQSNGSTTNRFIVPAGRNYADIILYLDVPVSTTVSFTDYSSLQTAPYSISNMAVYNSYYPHSIESGIADIYNNLTGNTTQNDAIGNASDAAGTLSDQIHQQEETWYDENSAAMEAVGLSSYRFTNQQASGILGVTTQFEQLWLALGNWTLVYIFVLMASLATFVIRHEPSTRVKQMREMYMTDRAVARDWEMRTNPEKFSHRRWVENNRRH